MRISASAIVDYLSCPQKSILRVTNRDDVTADQDMMVGTLFHSLAEKNWDKKELDTEFLEKIPEYALLDNNRNIKLWRCIENFRTYWSFPSDGKDDLIEYWFEVPFGDDVIVGKMDRVFSQNKIIVDWKTGSTNPTDKTIKKDIQFLIYDYAYEKLFGTRANLVLVNLNNIKVTNYYRDREIFDYFFNSGLFTILKGIKEKEYPYWGLFNGACYMCKYKDYCFGGKK